MTLNQALAAIRDNIRDSKGTGSEAVFLVCGFQPLHLGTFLEAFQTIRRSGEKSGLLTGIYGDFSGNLARAAESSALCAAVVLEWSDLDQRLGLRAAGGWSQDAKADILASVRERVPQVTEGLRRLASRMPVALAGPTLPLPPIGVTTRAQAGSLELELQHIASSLALEAAGVPGVRVVNASRLNEISGDFSSRLNPMMELLAGFPYQNGHASAVAQCLAEVLWPAPPKKGLITDLDDTLWAGLVGEAGSKGVSWSQEHHTQVHGLYQQMLGHLADSGVLLGVASKNEISLVKEALARKDLLLDGDALFPVLADWGAKSNSVGAILRVWNINADSVVFIDDNPMELSEVEQAFPGITCLRFPRSDAAKIWSLLGDLRDLFGKPAVLEEDRIRRDSIRNAAVIRDAGHEAGSPEFLATLKGTVTIDYTSTSADTRALELINKTNQFNLNGLRLSEGEWQRCLGQPGTMLVTVSYQDKFGPLGKIAVLLAQKSESRLRILNWVMSCRAFSRRIEHHTLDSLLRQSGAKVLELVYQPTDRNQPLQEFFAAIKVTDCHLAAADFHAECGELPHQISEITV